jgi:hypothetical protein
MKYNNLEVNKKYTLFTISLMATTKKTTIKFLGFSNSGSMVYRKITDAGNSGVGTNWLPRNPDAIILPGTSLDHGIYADSEIMLQGNAPHFTANAAYNLCSANEDRFREVIEQHTTENQRNSICLFNIDENFRRNRTGLFIYREDKEQQL